MDLTRSGQVTLDWSWVSLSPRWYREGFEELDKYCSSEAHFANGLPLSPTQRHARTCREKWKRDETAVDSLRRLI